MPLPPEEAALVDRILARLPERARAPMLAHLLDRTATVGSERPDLKPLLERLWEIRAREGAEERERALAAQAAKNAASVRVRLALVDGLEDGVRAAVLRAPGDQGIPVVLLRKDDATTGDIAMGLRAAARAFTRAGAKPAHASRVQLRGRHPEGVAVPGDQTLQVMLASLQASTRRDLPGDPSARTTDVFTWLPEYPGSGHPDD